MTISDAVRTKVRTYVTNRLQAVAAPKCWPLPRLATTVDLDDDAYQAVRSYPPPEVVPSPPDIAGPERRDLGVDTVPLQQVIHSITLSRSEVDLFKSTPEPDGPDLPASPRGKLDGLVARARRTQVNDLLGSLLGTVPFPGIEPVANLADAITAEPPSGRIVLVTMAPLSQETNAVVEEHREEGRLEHFPLHEALMTRAPTVSMFLARGTPPLAMRYLAHDLEVSVQDQSEGLWVTLEERRGWWAPPETQLRRFGATG